MGGKSKGGGKKGKANAQTRGKAPGGRVYEVAQAILNAPPGGVASVIRAALEDRDAPIRRDPRAFTMFSTRCRKKGEWSKCVEIFDAMREQGFADLSSLDGMSEEELCDRQVQSIEGGRRISDFLNKYWGGAPDFPKVSKFSTIGNREIK